MGQVIQGPWKPFSANSVSRMRTGIWECTIVRLRPRRPIPTEASLQALKHNAADEPARAANKSIAAPAS
jgi:hypothetical protein